MSSKSSFFVWFAADIIQTRIVTPPLTVCHFLQRNMWRDMKWMSSKLMEKSRRYQKLGHDYGHFLLSWVESDRALWSLCTTQLNSTQLNWMFRISKNSPTCWVELNRIVAVIIMLDPTQLNRLSWVELSRIIAVIIVLGPTQLSWVESGRALWKSLNKFNDSFWFIHLLSLLASFNECHNRIIINSE